MTYLVDTKRLNQFTGCFRLDLQYFGTNKMKEFVRILRIQMICVLFSGGKFSRAAREDGKIEAGFPIANLSSTKLSINI